MNKLLIFLFGITVLCFEAKSEEIKLRCFCYEQFSIKSQKATYCIEELHLRLDTINKRVNALVWVYDQLFDTFNFLLVDNSKVLDEKQAKKKFDMLVKKGIDKFIKRPVKNHIGKKWIEKQKLLKAR